MKLGFVRGVAGAFFLAYAVALTYPGLVPFNRIRPSVLGLPFVFFWVAAWVATAIAVLWLLDRAEMATDDAGVIDRSGAAVPADDDGPEA